MSNTDKSSSILVCFLFLSFHHVVIILFQVGICDVVVAAAVSAVSAVVAVSTTVVGGVFWE
eukprot:15278471-Ditylum_brightwellii.AAC.1